MRLARDKRQVETGVTPISEVSRWNANRTPRRAPSPFLGGGEKVAPGRMRGGAANAGARHPSPQPSPLLRGREKEPARGALPRTTRPLSPFTFHLSSAFTLIEVLLAIGILALVMTAIYASWAAVLRGAKVGNAAADEVQRMRIARQALDQSLASAVLYASNPRYYSFIADTTDEKFALLSFVAHLPPDFPGSGMFPNQPLRRVTFAVEPGTNSGPPALLLRQTSILTPTNSPIEESYTLTLSRNLAIFGVEFWSTNLNDWDVEWLPTNQVPKLLRVTLGFGGGQNAGAAPAIVVSSVISPGGPGVPRELQGNQPAAPTVLAPPGGRPARF